MKRKNRIRTRMAWAGHTTFLVLVIGLVITAGVGVDAWGVSGGGNPALKRVMVSSSTAPGSPTYLEVTGRFYSAPDGSTLTVTWPDGLVSECLVQDGACNFDLFLSNVAIGASGAQGVFYGSHALVASPCSGLVKVTLAGSVSREIAVACP